MKLKKLLLTLSLVGGLFAGGVLLATAAGCTPFLVASGGTGVCAIQSGTIPYGNGTGKISTTTAATPGQILGFQNGIPTPIASTTYANGTGISTSFANNTLTISLAAIAQGVLGNGVAASAVPTSQATSSLYGVAPAGGMVLGWNNTTSGIGWISTSTPPFNFAFPFTPVNATTVSTSTLVEFLGGSNGGIVVNAASSTVTGNLFISGNATSSTAAIGTTTVDVIHGVGFSVGTSTSFSAPLSIGIASSTSNGGFVKANWQTEGSQGKGGNIITYLLTQNLTLNVSATSSGAVSGMYGTELCQDGTGGRTLTIQNYGQLRYTDASGANATTTLLATANKCQMLFFLFHPVPTAGFSNPYFTVASSTQY